MSCHKQSLQTINNSAGANFLSAFVSFSCSHKQGLGGAGGETGKGLTNYNSWFYQYRSGQCGR